jgi:hypothetical protein
VLIVAETTDCIDLTTRDLYLVRRDGQVIHQPIWTSHWKDGFLFEAGRLTYWSEWFCHADNTERRAGSSYVYWFEETRGVFERRDVPEALYCGTSPEFRFLKFREPTRLREGR